MTDTREAPAVEAAATHTMPFSRALNAETTAI